MDSEQSGEIINYKIIIDTEQQNKKNLKNILYFFFVTNFYPNL